VNLHATVQRWNQDVVRGQGTEWNRGSTAYNRYQGDPSRQPHPCLGPMRCACCRAMSPPSSDYAPTSMQG